MAEVFPRTSCDLSLADVISDAEFDVQAIVDYMRQQGFTDDQILRTHISLNDSGSHKRRWESRMQASRILEDDDCGIRIKLVAGPSINAWLRLNEENGILEYVYNSLDETSTVLFSGALRRELNDLGKGIDNPPFSKSTLEHLGLTALYAYDMIDIPSSTNRDEAHASQEADNNASDQPLLKIKVARVPDVHA